MKQVFEDGFYHADPHAGNILVGADGVINLVDCGVAGYLTNDTLSVLSGLLMALGGGDYDRAATEILRLGAADELVDVFRFKQDVAAAVGRYYAMPLRFMNIGTMLEEIMALSRSHKVKIPPSLVLLVKTVVLVENLARTLDPDFRLGDAAEPFVRRFVRQRYAPTALARGLAAGVNDLNYYLRNIPREVNLLLARFVRGTARVEIEHRGLANALGEVDRSTNRLSFALIIAAVIISSALIFATGVGPKVMGYSAIGVVGFVVAAFLGLWLAFAVLRSGRL